MSFLIMVSLCLSQTSSRARGEKSRTYQELFIRDPAVAVLVSELEHLADLGLGDVLGEVGHHLAEVGETEGLLLDLVLLCSELDGVRLRPADILSKRTFYNFGKIGEYFVIFSLYVPSKILQACLTLNIICRKFSSSNSRNFLRQSLQKSGKKILPFFSTSHCMSTTSCSVGDSPSDFMAASRS